MGLFMKKLISTIALGSVLATVASADLTRVEAGAGAWGYTPSGTITYTDSNINGDLTNTSSEKAQTSAYVWMLIKHPIPFVPNIRLEYNTIHDEGKVTGASSGWNIPVGTDYTLDVTEYDVIPYYNLLDNTFWTTIDAGVDIKILQSDYVAKGAGVGPLNTGDYTRKDSLVVPLAYLRSRVEIPFTGIGIEADAKYISYEGNTVYDVRAKVDYTLDFIPVIQPGIELGYRAQHVKFESQDKTLKANMDFKGVYFGAIVRF
jgi:outer membrane protein